MAEVAPSVSFYSHPSTPSLVDSDVPPQSTALDDFRAQLASCRRFSAIDQRTFYLDSRLLEWFRSTPANDPESKSTNAGRLLLVVSDSVERSNPNFVNTLLEHMSDDDNRCWLRVFAILLWLDLEKLNPLVSATGRRLNKAKMLNRFFYTNVCDRKLPMGVADLSKEIGTFGLDPDEVSEFAERFEALQWEFCTREAFDDAYNHKYGYDKMILPICTMAKVKPGGSGKIFQIEVPVECIPKTLAAKITVRPYRKDDHSGEYQQFALKVLEDAEDYDQETFAYNALQRADGMIVQCLGCWEYTLSPVQKEYHLLLEWGTYDLDDYFGFRAPPAVADDIVQFWKSLTGLILALAKIHLLEVTNDGSHKTRYYGWHGDLKPENLLYCEESRKKGWKIGDPGFARFVKRDYAELDSAKLPVISIRGGTLTYGGPERAQDERMKVSQRFDIWSLGCVLSEVATWVVLGIRGVQQFRHVRRQRAGDAEDEIDLDDNDDFEKHGRDRFHNGNDTSDAILKWHKYLKQAIRKCDPITAAILDLVEQNMLVREPVKRITAPELVRRMKRLVEAAESSVAKNVYSTPKSFRVPFKVEQRKESVFLQESWEISTSNPTTTNMVRSVKYKSKRFIDATKEHMDGSSANIDSLMLPISQTDELADQDDFFLRKSQTLPRNSKYSSLSAIEANMELRKVQSYADTDTGAKLTYWVARAVLEEMGWMSKALELPSDEMRLPPGSTQRPLRPVEENLGSRLSQAAFSQATLTQPTAPSPKSPKAKSMSLLRKFSSKRISWGKATEAQPSTPTTPLSGPSTLQPTSPSTTQPLQSPQTPVDERSRYKDFDKHFQDRDVIFLIDNGSSMPRHWPYAKDLMSVLAAFLYLQDDNGMDLFFTSTKERFGPFVQPKDFINIMNNMSPVAPASDSTAIEQATSSDVHAPSVKGGRDDNPANDIRKTLRHILGLWREEFQRKLTLIILTDGVWRGVSEKRSVANQIVTFLESWQDEDALKQMLKERELSIQFIQFGDDPRAREEFEYMDNHLKSSGGVRLPDIIDHEPAHDGDIRKMVIGSISVEWDNDNTTVQSTTDEHENLAAGGTTPVANPFHANGVDSYYSSAQIGRPTPKTIAQDTTLSGAKFADAATSSPKVHSSQTWTRGYSDTVHN